MRPTEYRSEYAEQAFKYCLLGATDGELARFFEVCEKTINNWKLQFPEFLQSVKEGKKKADSEVAEGLYKRAKGFEWIEEVPIKRKVAKDVEEIVMVKVRRVIPTDTQAASLWLRNRASDRWKDKQEVDTTLTIVVQPKLALSNEASLVIDQFEEIIDVESADLLPSPQTA